MRFAMNGEPENPYEPPKSDMIPQPPEKMSTPLWEQRTFMDWYGELGQRKRRIYFGGIIIAFSIVAWMFGVVFPVLAAVGGACLVVGLLSSRDDD